MSKDNPQAAGEVGPKSVGASDLQPRKPGGPPPNTPSGNPSELRTEDALAKSDEELRRMAVARLAEQLDIGSSLIARCEEQAEVKRGDRLGPLYAAARLMNANARVARALAHVAQVENRHRSIVERVQPPAPKTADLNSTLQGALIDALVLKMAHRLNAIAEEDFPLPKNEGPDRGSAPNA